MESLKVFDVLNLQEDKEIKNIIKDEKIYYSDLIKKINHYGSEQERNIILTDKGLYNIKKKH